MKNLLTFLLLLFSLTTFGQSNSQTIEIKYWKSIADSNDTVAYREYLQRYGENGLYKDEALTRIALLKTSGKQEQSERIECSFYINQTYSYPYFVRHTVVRFTDNQDKVWLKATFFNLVRSNLAISKDFYENQAAIPLSRGTQEYKDAINNDKKAIEEAEYAKKFEKNRRKKSEILQKAEQAKSPDDYNNAWTKDEEYKYDPMKSTSARDVYFKRDNLHEIDLVTYYYDERGYHRSHKDEHHIFYVFSGDLENDEYYKKESGEEYTHLKYEFKKTIQGYSYIAFSKDKSSFIMWFEKDDNLDGVIYEKRYYYRKPKEELLPKAVNYDFLNR